MTYGETASRRLSWGPFEIDRLSRELRRNGEPVAIQEKPLRLLEALFEANGDVVTRTALRDRLWPDSQFVDHETGIHTAVRKLREALGDSAKEPRWIETLPGVGYRLLRLIDEPAFGRLEPTRTVRQGPHWLTVAAAATILLAAALAPHLGEIATKNDPATASQSPLNNSLLHPGGNGALPFDGPSRRAYLEGRYLKREGSRAALERATELFTAVVRADPEFAPGHAELSWVLARRVLFGSPTCAHCRERARQELAAALELDNQLDVALLAEGMIALFFDWDSERAGRAIGRAAALSQDSAEVQLALATWHSTVGRHDDAISAVQRAVELDPESLVARSDAGFFLLAAGRLQEAVAECSRALELDPGFVAAHSCLLRAHERLGAVISAALHARELLRVYGATEADLDRLDQAVGADKLAVFRRWTLDRFGDGDGLSTVGIAALHATLGDSVQALAWLQQAYAEKDPELALLLTYDDFESLRADAAFIELVERIGLS